MLAIQAGNSGQGIDENPVTVNKGVQSWCIIDVNNRCWEVWAIIYKVGCISSIRSSISGNLGDFSQLKLNLSFVNATKYVG